MSETEKLADRLDSIAGNLALAPDDSEALMDAAAALRSAEARNRELEAEIERRERVAREAWGDQEDEHTAAIQAAHPVNSRAFEVFDKALAMVGKRHGKYELVGLVCWLLLRAEVAEAQVARARELVRELHRYAAEAIQAAGCGFRGWDQLDVAAASWLALSREKK